MGRFLPLLLGTVVLASGCYNKQTADQVEAKAQEKLQEEGARQTGLPQITNFTERKFLKLLYELRDQGVKTYIYKTDLNGRHHLVGTGIGFPLSASVQYSNPQRIMPYQISSAGGYQHEPMPQAEPNALFMPSSAEGSWVMLMTSEGPKPYYSEDRLTGSPVRIPGADESEAIPDSPGPLLKP